MNTGPPLTIEQQLREMNEALLLSSIRQHELTEQAEQANAALRESERRFREMIDALPAAIYTTDAQGRLTHFNPAAIEFSGRTPVLGEDEWCVTAKLFLADGTPLPHDQSPLAIAIKEGRSIRGTEAISERPDGTQVWGALHPTALRNSAGEIVGCINMVVDITELKRNKEHTTLLLAEVNHRSMNLLAVVRAVALQTAKHSDPATFVTRLSERIASLAASQNLLVKNQWRGIEVAKLVEAQLDHFKDLIGTRVLLDGPSVRLTAAAAQGIGMALHELATNASKYGALSNSEGRVRISWQVSAVEKPTFSMAWLEQGGPNVTPPTRNGFGQTVIGRMVEAAVDGTAVIEYREPGVSWELTALAANTLETGTGTRRASNASL